ncbi:MAG: leucine-rich repeat domain-containing protein [Bacteroidales bacterium]|nr:leucine-rich repeat domain-containing protein [Bacteroidales bacterium]
MKTRLLLFFVLLIGCIERVGAEWFREGDLCYRVINKSLAQVEVYQSVELDDTGNLILRQDKYAGHIVIPETVTHNGTNYTIVGIGKRAFADSYITAIATPSTVQYIDSFAFANSEVLKAEIRYVKSIEWGAFQNCVHLISVRCDSINKIGAYCFSHCERLERFDYCYLDVIPSFAFYECGFEEFRIHSRIVKRSAFSNCDKIEYIHFSSSLQELDIRAFSVRQRNAVFIFEGKQPPMFVDDFILSKSKKSLMGYDKMGVIKVPIGSKVAYKRAFKKSSLVYRKLEIY